MSKKRKYDFFGFENFGENSTTIVADGVLTSEMIEEAAKKALEECGKPDPAFCLICLHIIDINHARVPTGRIPALCHRCNTVKNRKLLKNLFK